jgi:hypothetical protein
MRILQKKQHVYLNYIVFNLISIIQNHYNIINLTIYHPPQAFGWHFPYIPVICTKDQSSFNNILGEIRLFVV